MDVSNKNKVEKYERKCVSYYNMKKYDLFSEEGDGIEICDWFNGEGFDIAFIRKGIQNINVISFTYGEFDVIKKLVEKMHEIELE
jgi:hypothetical protein